MIDNDEVLESMQADILGILQHTPSLRGHVFMDNEGDFNSRLEKALGTKTAGSTGKRGLAVIVLQVDVTDAEKNLPGPPLKMRVRVLVIENIVINRSATKGTLQRSSQAALNVLNTLQLTGLGAHTLYADKSPIAPQTVPEGISSHMVTLYVQSGMNPIIKPLAVQAELIPGGITVSGELTNSGSPITFPVLLFDPDFGGSKPFYSDSGDYAGANMRMQWYDSDGGYWLLDYGGSAAWKSTDAVATPDLATTWIPDPDFAGGGVPIIALQATSQVTLTCASPSSAIRYTADGSYPSPSKTLYAGPFVLPAAGTVIRAAAYVADQPPSDILELTVTE